MVNHRLRGALLAAEMSVYDLAERVEVDAKSVSRWITEDRLPHPPARVKVARELYQSETYLWPTLLEAAQGKDQTAQELKGVWATRSSVSVDLWHSLFSQTKMRLDILVYAGGFLVETLDLVDVIRWKAKQGVEARILIGDPSSDAVRVRGIEENLPWLAQRCTSTLRYLADASQTGAACIRTHATTLYASHFRFDDSMLINAHSYGVWACQSPVYQFRRVEGGQLFDYYADAFERVWVTGRAADECQ